MARRIHPVDHASKPCLAIPNNEKTWLKAEDGEALEAPDRYLELQGVNEVANLPRKPDKVNRKYKHPPSQEPQIPGLPPCTNTGLVYVPFPSSSCTPFIIPSHPPCYHSYTRLCPNPTQRHPRSPPLTPMADQQPPSSTSKAVLSSTQLSVVLTAKLHCMQADH
jgi:hypothetical protein